MSNSNPYKVAHDLLKPDRIAVEEMCKLRKEVEKYYSSQHFRILGDGTTIVIELKDDFGKCLMGIRVVACVQMGEPFFHIVGGGMHERATRYVKTALEDIARCMAEALVKHGIVK